MNNNPKEWKLTSFKLEFKSGWAHQNTKDRYEGFVSFQNKDYEQFTLKITPELSVDFIKLITDKLGASVNELSSVVLKSLKDVAGDSREEQK